MFIVDAADRDRFSEAKAELDVNFALTLCSSPSLVRQAGERLPVKICKVPEEHVL